MKGASGSYRGGVSLNVIDSEVLKEYVRQVRQVGRR